MDQKYQLSLELRHKGKNKYIPCLTYCVKLSIEDFVYGATDGAVTTFAVVAGVVGASLSPSVILIMGFANLFADGLSMSIGNYEPEDS